MRGALALAAMCLAPAAARASGGFLPYDELHLLVGPNIGAALGEAGDGLLLGGEVSFVRHQEGLWYGVYGDYVHDMDRDAGRAGGGLEAGLVFFGLDAGYVRDLEAEAHGFRVRGVLTVALASAYGGGGKLFPAGGDVGFWEVGLLLKMSVLTHTDGDVWDWLPMF